MTLEQFLILNLILIWHHLLPWNLSIPKKLILSRCVVLYSSILDMSQTFRYTHLNRESLEMSLIRQRSFESLACGLVFCTKTLSLPEIHHSCNALVEFVRDLAQLINDDRGLTFVGYQVSLASIIVMLHAHRLLYFKGVSVFPF